MTQKSAFMHKKEKVNQKQLQQVYIVNTGMEDIIEKYSDEYSGFLKDPSHYRYPKAE